ncbi:MAG: glutaredoxin domain-containing protein [Bacteroidota bacterium]
MTLQNINSLGEMQLSLKEDARNYVLLFKKGSETSECSYKNIEHVLGEGIDVNVVAADVVKVRDIHIEYDIKSVPTLLVFQGKKFEKTVKGCNDDGYYKSLFESALFSAKIVDGENPQKRVTVYSTPTCSWCTTLKTHLKKNGIRYTDVDVSKDQKAAENMAKRSGQQGVPQTDIGGEMIVGFDKNRINTLLGI